MPYFAVWVATSSVLCQTYNFIFSHMVRLVFFSQYICFVSAGLHFHFGWQYFRLSWTQNAPIRAYLDEMKIFEFSLLCRYDWPKYDFNRCAANRNWKPGQPSLNDELILPSPNNEIFTCLWKIINNKLSFPLYRHPNIMRFYIWFYDDIKILFGIGTGIGGWTLETFTKCTEHGPRCRTIYIPSDRCIALLSFE